MIDLDDTIVAIATPRGGAIRGIVRLAGPRAWEFAAANFDSALPEPTREFHPVAVDGQFRLPPPFHSPLPATFYLSRTPRSFTGQDQVEIHTIGSPPILEALVTALVAGGCRLAIAGEFTMRAFLNGKLDLTAAEAVAGLIDARTPRQAEVALAQIAGGIARPMHALRDRLLDLLAELEAGLDFVEEDIRFVQRSELRARLVAARTTLADLAAQMRARALADDCRRAVLVGPPNVGKSSLFNALVGRDAAIISDTAGTTRDYLVATLNFGDCSIELVDTAGIEAAADVIARHADAQRDAATAIAELVLWCDDSPGLESLASPYAELLDRAALVIRIRTKCDLTPAKSDREVPLDVSSLARRASVVSVSALTGEGINALRSTIAAWVSCAADSESGVVASTAVRCRDALRTSLESVDRAIAASDSDTSDEFIALELRLALDGLAQVVGAVYTDDILDRVFSRFCIGK